MGLAYLMEFDMSSEDHAALVKAGYRVEILTQNIKLPRGETVFIVGIATDILGALTPPLCPYCHAMMAEHTEDISRWYSCPQCGAEEHQVRVPPKTADKFVEMPPDD